MNLFRDIMETGDSSKFFEQQPKVTWVLVVIRLLQTLHCCSMYGLQLCFMICFSTGEYFIVHIHSDITARKAE